MGEEKAEEESKPKDEESKEEEMKVKEAVDTEDTKNESESTEKTTEAEKAEQLALFTEIDSKYLKYRLIYLLRGVLRYSVF